LKIPDNKLFTADRSDKVVDVFQGLVKHNFLSVPVLTQVESKYYGFIDMFDIMNYIVVSIGEQKLRGSEDMWSLLRSETHFSTLQVNDIMKYPYKSSNPFHPVKGGYSLYYAIEALAKEQHLHRLAVINDERNLLSLVTQSLVVEFLKKNIDLIGSKINKPVREMQHVFHMVYKIRRDDSVISGFNLMREKSVYGIAVVDDADKLVGTLSVTDVKALYSDGQMFWRLFQTVGHFLDKLKKDYNEKHNRTRIQTCKKDTTLKDVIFKLVDNKLHRLFIVDDDTKVIGIISLKDVLQEIISL